MLRSMQVNKSDPNIVITGYASVISGQLDAEARVYIDDLITVT
jgi:hypothetical protein